MCRDGELPGGVRSDLLQIRRATDKKLRLIGHRSECSHCFESNAHVHVRHFGSRYPSNCGFLTCTEKHGIDCSLHTYGIRLMSCDLECCEILLH